MSRQAQVQTLGFLAESADGTTAPTAVLDPSTASEWSATMRLTSSGDYDVAGGGSAVAIDGQMVVSATQPAASVFLARGAHAIHLTHPEGAPAPLLRVSLSRAAPQPTPDAKPSADQAPLFFALPAPGGLLFTWQVEGRPLQALVDSAPHRGFEGTFNDGRPWTAQWRGNLRITRGGDYTFRLEAISTATLFLDDRSVLPAPPGGSAETSVPLDPGWHIIRVEYADRDPYARLFLNWRPPGESEFSALPDEVFQPAL